MVASRKSISLLNKSWSCKSAAIAKAIACSFLPIQFWTHSADPNDFWKSSSTFYLYHGFEKVFAGALIESIEQVENDRIVEMTVSNKTRLETISRLPWLLKLWGNTVIFYWSIKAVIKSSKLSNTSVFSQNSYRTLLPGSTYIAPPSTESLNPFTIKDEKLFEILQTQELTAKKSSKPLSRSGTRYGKWIGKDTG